MAGGGQVRDEAFVTLATNDTYALGALVLAHSLRRAGTTRQLAIMVTPGLTQGIRAQLSQVFDLVQEVNVLDSQDEANLALLTRPDLGITFTKLHCWRLTQYSKCVFLDADTLVLSNVDELFEREELSAAPDVGWPDCFNSGVFVFRPSQETYQALLQFAITNGSFDGGDQGLLNMYFSDWATKDIARHLPFIYNCVSTTFYSYAPSFKYFGKNIKIVHFIGASKPWHHSFNTASGQVEGGAQGQSPYLQAWWKVFMECVQPHIDAGLVGIQGGVAKIGAFSPEELSDPNRRHQWEKGQIDYTGIDSFDNIQLRLQQMMSSKEEAESAIGPVVSEPPKPKVQLTPSGKPLKPAIKQPKK
jgi:glycogenin glucosyltransferase